MPTYKTILVPLDGSQRAEAIFPYVEELAQACSAALVFLEVIEKLPPHAVVVAPDNLAEGVQRRADEIKSYGEQIAAQYQRAGLPPAASWSTAHPLRVFSRARSRNTRT